MRRVAAALLGALAGGITAGGVKVFLLNAGPPPGPSDWFILAWLGSMAAGAAGAVSGSPVRGLLVGLVLALPTALLLAAAPPLPHVITGGACLVAGFVGGLIGRAFRRPVRRRPSSPPPDLDEDGVD